MLSRVVGSTTPVSCGDPMSQSRHTDPIGSIGWTERTGGVLTTRECLSLAAAPAAGGARHPRRPSRDGTPDALGAPERHRPGAPRAAGLLTRQRCRGGGPGPPDPGTPEPFPPCLRVGRGPRRACTRSRSTVSCSTWRRCSTTQGFRARCPTSTSRCAARRWHETSPTAMACLRMTASSSPTRSPCTTAPA